MMADPFGLTAKEARKYAAWLMGVLAMVKAWVEEDGANAEEVMRRLADHQWEWHQRSLELEKKEKELQ